MVYYIQINLISIVSLITVYLIMHRRAGVLPLPRRAYGYLVILTIVACLSDVAVNYLDRKTFAGAKVYNEIATTVDFIVLIWVCYFWNNYARIMAGSSEKTGRTLSRLLAVPPALLTVSVLINHFTGFVFEINEENVRVSKIGASIHWSIGLCYFLFSVTVLIIKLRKETGRSEKRILLQMLFLNSFPIIGGLFEVLFKGLSGVECGIALAIVILMFGTLDNQISTDSLTGLNNRRALENFAYELLREKNGRNVTVVMCDVDKFKTINDKNGHAYGDIALKKMAETLKNACRDCHFPVFLCRYGGDEFVLCTYDSYSGVDHFDELKKNIFAELANTNSGKTKNERLDVSVGHAGGYIESEKDFDSLIELADAAMYDVKRKKSLISGE